MLDTRNLFLCVMGPSQEGDKFARELVISQGQYVYLRLKTWGALTESHCEIVPIPVTCIAMLVSCFSITFSFPCVSAAQHVSSTLQAEEEVWTEIDRYKGCLKAMFARDDECVIFTEIATKVRLPSFAACLLCCG